MNDKYQRVTKAQFDLWLGDPVTEAVLSCYGWMEDSVREQIGKGVYRNPMSNDLTCNATSHAHGMADAMANAANAEGMLNHFQMLEEEDDSDESGVA